MLMPGWLLHLSIALSERCLDNVEISEPSFINYDGAMLEIYLDRKFQWPQEGLNCESLACEVVT